MNTLHENAIELVAELKKRLPRNVTITVILRTENEEFEDISVATTEDDNQNVVDAITAWHSAPDNVSH